MGPSKFKSGGLKRLGDSLDAYVKDGDVPGYGLLVSRGDEVHAHAAGTLARGSGAAPAARDSIYRISSMTKPVTAAAAMILVDEGRLHLDAPIERWVPELANRRVLRTPESPLDDTVPAVRSITPRDLLNFTFGMGLVMAPPGTYPIQKAIHERELGDGPPSPQTPPAPDEYLRRFAELPLIRQPGDKWMYDTGSQLLGILIARVAEKSFPDFLRERIFEPLGMKDTGFVVKKDRVARFATAYASAEEDFAVYDSATKGEWNREPAFPSGASGLVSTLDDYHAFAKLLLSDGKPGKTRILSEMSVRQMTQDQLTPAQKKGAGFTPQMFDGQGFGFGVGVVTAQSRPQEPVGQYGWPGGLGTVWFNDSKNKLIGILLTQVAWSSPEMPPMGEDFKRLVYDALLV